MKLLSVCAVSYTHLAVSMLIYGCESWIMRKRDKSRIQAEEMKFLRSVKGCSNKIDLEMERLENIYNLNDEIGLHRRLWMIED